MIFDDFSEMNFRRMGMSRAIKDITKEITNLLDTLDLPNLREETYAEVEKVLLLKGAFLANVIKTRIELDGLYRSRKEPNE